MKNFKRMMSLILALIMVVALVACGGDKPATSSTPAKDDTSKGALLDNTIKTGRKDLNIALTSPIVTADPHGNSKAATMLMFNWVYNGLVFADGNGEITPDLASSWETKNDGMDWVFQIRKDIKFHDGSAMTMEDVVYSFQRAKDLAYFKNYLVSVKSFEQTGDWEFTIHLKEPNNAFLFDIYNIKVTSKAICEKKGDEFGKGADLAGTGPYIIKEYNPNALIVLEKNPNYHGECGNIEKVNAHIITNNSTRVTALQTGELDFIEVPSSSWEQIVETKKYNTQLIETTTIVQFIVTNYDQSFPQYDKRVRQAMRYAIDRDAIVEVATAGKGTKAYILYNDKYIVGANDDAFQGTYEYNPEKAKELLKAAGYENGCDIGIFLVAAVGDNEQVAQMLVNMWSEVGITAKIEMQDSTTASALSKGTIIYAEDGKTPTGATAYQGVYMNPSQMVHYQGNGKRAIHSDNFKTTVAKYWSDELDSYLERAQAASTDKERDEWYQKVCEFLNEESVNNPIYYTGAGYAWAQGLNVVLSPYYILPQLMSWS